MVYVSTHKGKHHLQSEDSVLVGDKVLADVTIALPIPEQGFVCISDGVGGNKGGDQASRFILDHLRQWNVDSEIGLSDFLKETNSALIKMASENSITRNMAATLTGFYLAKDHIKMLHVGNTRAYIKQGNYLKQLTSDHTTYNWLITNGQKEAAESCNKNEITNCFGGNNPALLSKLHINDISAFSLAIITSDGIHDHIDIDTLENIISSDFSYSEKCEELIQKALEAGSDDDMSVVIICSEKNE